MSSRRVETKKDVIKQLYDTKFGNLSQDIQEIIEEIIQKQEEEEAKKKLKLNMRSKYTNDLLLINKNIRTNNKNIRTNKTNINKNIYNNTNGGHRNNMNMKDIKYMCKANQIKLSKVVNDARIVYTKKELITKLKRRKII